MTYDLYCVVNAIGMPYNDTFRETEGAAWTAHYWRDVPKDGDHPDSCLIPTSEKHQAKLRANGDRVVRAHIETNETVTVNLAP